MEILILSVNFLYTSLWCKENIEELRYMLHKEYSNLSIYVNGEISNAFAQA